MLHPKTKVLSSAIFGELFIFFSAIILWVPKTSTSKAGKTESSRYFESTQESQFTRKRYGMPFVQQLR